MQVEGEKCYLYRGFEIEIEKRDNSIAFDPAFDKQ